ESFVDDHFHFINPKEVNIDSILEIASALIYRYGIKGLVIDPYNELDHNRPAGITETEYVSQFLSKVRRFARKKDIAVWVVAHPTKPIKDHKISAPTAYDISGSANWANKADNALSVFRTSGNEVQIHIKKIRFKEVGKLGVVDLKYDNKNGRYSVFNLKFKSNSAD
ncbi:MAG: bifunctional DNA primase/helicase, partial [Candidatus Marinimicrobia bacterium]|nr:bifunctional DNA primase/helicase [Candidatus Neomarinimicrobiota bacterium]